jgi:hypothetical protein
MLVCSGICNIQRLPVTRHIRFRRIPPMHRSASLKMRRGRRTDCRSGCSRINRKVPAEVSRQVNLLKRAMGVVHQRSLGSVDSSDETRTYTGVQLLVALPSICLIWPRQRLPTSPLRRSDLPPSHAESLAATLAASSCSPLPRSAPGLVAAEQVHHHSAVLHDVVAHRQYRRAIAE